MFTFTFSIFLVLFVSIYSTLGQDLRQCWDKSSEMAKNPYFIGNGFTCCNNILMSQPIRPKNEHWRKCMSQQWKGNPDEEIPSILWSNYLCELSSASNGAFTPENLSYKKFEELFMKNYPKLIKEKFIARNASCEVPKEANLATTLKKYESCFLQTEEGICFGMAGIQVPGTGNPLPPPPPRRTCEPLESLSKPNHAFETFAQPCCKGQELPYPLFDIFMDFDRFDVGQNVATCSENIKTRLRELNHPIGSLREPLTMCQVACVHEVDGMPGKYNMDFNELLQFKLKSLSNSTKTNILSVISKYQPTFQVYGSNTSIPMDQVGMEVSKLPEAEQILNYCKFQFEATAEAYRALYEHCYNSEYGNQFREDIINPSPPTPIDNGRRQNY